MLIGAPDHQQRPELIPETHYWKDRWSTKNKSVRRKPLLTSWMKKRLRNIHCIEINNSS